MLSRIGAIGSLGCVRRGNSLPAINRWQSGADLVHIGGFAQASWSHSAGTSGPRTLILPPYAFRQAGLLRRVVVRFGPDAAAGATAKVKVFRYNTETSLYDPVAEESFAVASAGEATQTVDLVSPIPVQTGDIPGIYCPSGSNVVRITGGVSTTTASRLVSLADVTTSNAFTSTFSTSLEIEFFGGPPYLAITGDSIPEGHNTASNYHGALHTAAAGLITLPGGTAAAEPGYWIRATLFGGSVLRYQNLALGSVKWSWVQANISNVTAVKPHTVWIHAGINDVSGATEWATVQGNIEATIAALKAGGVQKILITEILPWTGASDAQAATIRTWNASLATVCAAQGAVLVRAHDAMGQTRVSTGELDDLKAAYSQDGLHLTDAGVQALAVLVRNIL